MFRSQPNANPASGVLALASLIGLVGFGCTDRTIEQNARHGCSTCITSESLNDAFREESETSADTPDTCMRYTQVCACTDDRDDAIFQVLRPNGEEEFVIGTKETLYVCLEADNDLYPEEDYAYGLEQATEWLSVDNGETWGTLTFSSLRRNDEMNAYYWTIPDSIDVDKGGEIQTISAVSDSCLFRVQIYSADGDPSVNYDVSDQVFSIVKEPSASVRY